MANTVYVKVDNLATVLLSYDRIKIYKSATIGGSYTEVTNAGSRPIINSQDDLYLYLDSPGITTDFYKASYYNSSTFVESTLSDPIAGSPFNQLLENMIVTIIVSGTIKDMFGNEIGEDQEFYFTTTYKPLYSSIRRVKLDVGPFVKGIPDDTINLAIFEASREADYLTFDKDTANYSDLYIHARRQYTSYRSEQILLSNMTAAGLIKSKKLGDFQVDYDSTAISKILDKISADLVRWEKQINTGGKGTQTLRNFIKGANDPDRPRNGRMWERPDGWPVANARFVTSSGRRWEKGYLPRTLGIWDDE